MADDPFAFEQDCLEYAARSSAAATFDAPFAKIPKCILVGTGGTIVGRLIDDIADRTFVVPAGYNPLRFKQMNSASLTAANILLLF